MKHLVVHRRAAVSNDRLFVLFDGMNVLESRDLALRICEHYMTVTQRFIRLNIFAELKAQFSVTSPMYMKRTRRCK